MRGAVLYAPGDIRVVDRNDPTIIAPTDAIIRLTATCVCGSDPGTAAAPPGPRLWTPERTTSTSRQSPKVPSSGAYSGTSARFFSITTATPPWLGLRQ